MAGILDGTLAALAVFIAAEDFSKRLGEPKARALFADARVKELLAGLAFELAPEPTDEAEELAREMLARYKDSHNPAELRSAIAALITLLALRLSRAAEFIYAKMRGDEEPRGITSYKSELDAAVQAAQDVTGLLEEAILSAPSVSYGALGTDVVLKASFVDEARYRALKPDQQGELLAREILVPVLASSAKRG